MTFLPRIARTAATIIASGTPPGWWSEAFDERLAIAKVLVLDHAWVVDSAAALVVRA